MTVHRDGTEQERDAAGEALTDDAITRDFRILQRRKGHRYAIDDVATAAEAVRLGAAGAYADLGCGVGSVLLMVAWSLRPARIAGVEAQAESFSLALRNVRRAGLAPRTELVHGDLRHVAASPTFDRVTGTPPYLPVGQALASPDPQRAACRLELRGGVEDYVEAASRWLAPDGAFVVCADGRAPGRVLGAAERASLVVARRLDVWAHARAATPLFSVWTLRRRRTGPEERADLRLRREDGQRTDEVLALRAVFGL